MTSRGRTDPGTGPGPIKYPGTFLVALQDALASLDWKIRRWRGTMVECVDAEEQEHVLGVENLYRLARGRDRTERPALLAEFLHAARNAEHGKNLPERLVDAAHQLL